MAKPGARDRTAGRFGLRAYLADTITSLRAQRFRGVWEIVVVGNNCTDDTAEIARGLGARVVGERMRGVCNARQREPRRARDRSSSRPTPIRSTRPMAGHVDASFRSDNRIVAVVGPCRYADGPLWRRIYGRLVFDLSHLI